MRDEVIQKILNIEDNYKSDTKLYTEYLESNGLNVGIDSLKSWALYLRSSGKSASTINRRISAIKSRLRLLFQESGEQAFNVLDQFTIERDLNAVKRMKINTRAVDPSKVLSKDEVKTLINESSQRIGLMIEFFYLTGCRISEVLGVMKSDIQRTRNYVIVRIVGKGSKERHVRIPINLFNRIQSTFNGKVFLFETLQHERYDITYVERVVRENGWKYLGRRVTPHFFRHSFATHKIEETGKVKAVSRYLGHASTTVTQDMYNQEQLYWEELSQL